jgi:hypothetical protein
MKLLYPVSINKLLAHQTVLMRSFSVFSSVPNIEKIVRTVNTGEKLF